MKYVRILSVVLLTAIFAVPAHAQLKQNDFRKRVSRTEQKRFNTPTKSYPTNQQFGGKTYSKSTWTGGTASINGQRAPLSVSETRSKKLFKTKTVEKKTWKRKTALGFSGKRARFENSDKDQEIKLSPKYDNARIHQYTNMDRHGFTTPDSGDPQFSLQDINRYVFRENRSSTKGLPVQEAGSGKTDGPSPGATPQQAPKPQPAATNTSSNAKQSNTQNTSPRIPVIQAGPVTTSSRVKD